MKEWHIFERIFPEPWTILGLKLLPLKLGHIHHLHRIDSPFIAVDSSPKLTQAPYEALAAAVFICSRSYEETIRASDDPTTPKAMRRWSRKVHGATCFRKGKPIDILAKWKMFQQYLDANSLRFEEGKDYYIDSDRTRTMALPFVHAVRIKLQSRMHFSDSEIMNRGWALCVLDYHGLCDIDGVIQLGGREATQDAIAEAQSVAKRVAEKLKEKRNGN